MAHYNRMVLLLSALRLAAAAPTVDVTRRQDSTNTIAACTDNGCTDCPLNLNTGTGYPQCEIYNYSDLAQYGFTAADDGTETIFFNVPELDSGCKVIIQTPVTQDTSHCGGNVLVAQGATCAPIQVDSTFIIQFCCGTGDCGAAGAPAKRETSANPAFSAARGLAGAQALYLTDRNGDIIHPHPIQEASSAKRASNIVAKSPSPAAMAKRTLAKRDCDSFTVTREPYTVAGAESIISPEVTCGATESCMATEESSVSQTFSVDVSVSVSDPFGIVSASVDVGWSETQERSFSASYTFGAGETGYVVFTPILTCVDGYFNGDCDGNGQQTTACGPTTTAGEMTGDIRGVIVRG